MAEMTWRTEDINVSLNVSPSRDGCQRTVLSVTRAGFTAIRSSWLDDGDLQRFADEIHLMWRRLTGTAELTIDRGAVFSLQLAMGTGGHVGIRVTVTEEWGRMEVEAETDQTFLPALHDGLLSLR